LERKRRRIETFWGKTFGGFLFCSEKIEKKFHKKFEKEKLPESEKKISFFLI